MRTNRLWMAARTILAMAPLAAALSGCLWQQDLNGPATKVSAPSGTALPLAARTMIFIPQGDLERPLIIEATRFRTEETSTKDGQALSRAATAILSQVFAQVDTNRPAIRPQLIAKIQGSPKFSRLDNIMRVGCGIDLFQPDGARLGSFVARDDDNGPSDYSQSLEAGYRRCLKKAADQMTASPQLRNAATAGFPAPNTAAYVSFIESLGLRP